MITLFTAPRPFADIYETIQRNAIASWTCLRPKPDVILFGDESGIKEMATKLGARHFSHIARTDEGGLSLRYLFNQAQSLAFGDIMGLVNADIILLSDFMPAIEAIASKLDKFLAVGGRTEIDDRFKIDFANPGWEKALRKLAAKKGLLGGCADFFVFRRGMFRDLIPFNYGRYHWDTWLMGQALAQKDVDLVNVTGVVLSIHQSHPRHDGEGKAVMRNLGYQSGMGCGRSGANLILTKNGLVLS